MVKLEDIIYQTGGIKMDTVTAEETVETSTQIVNIETEIERIKSLLDKETEKKLEVVRLYLLMHHEVSASIGSVEDLANYLPCKVCNIKSFFCHVKSHTFH